MEEDEVVRKRFRRLVELREDRDVTKKAATKAENAYRSYEAELFEQLQDSPVKGSRKVDLGPPYGTVTFRPRSTVYGRVLDAEQALEYFEQSGLLAEMAKQKIAKSKLNEIAKECVEQHKDLPPGIDFYRNEGITITRRKS